MIPITRTRMEIVIGQEDHRHHCARPGDGRHRQWEHREVAPRLWRSRLRLHFPEKHLQTEQEQNYAAGHFERVQVNADRVENGAGGFSDIEGKATRVGASECGQRTSFN